MMKCTECPIPDLCGMKRCELGVGDCHLTRGDFEAIRCALAGSGRLVLQVRGCRTCAHIEAVHDGTKLNAWCAKRRLWSENLPDECGEWQPKEDGQ